MTDNEIYSMYNHYDHLSFHNCVGGRIIWGEQVIGWFSPDGRMMGGTHNIGGWQHVIRAYWDRNYEYGDFIHIETSSGTHCFVNNACCGVMR